MLTKLAKLLDKIEVYAEKSSINDFIDIYPGKKIKKVFGPYRKNDKYGREIVIVLFEDGSKKTVSLAKWIMSQHLGKELDPDLHTVDHKNYDKYDNSIDNLQIIDRPTHSGLDAKRVRLVECKCDLCGKKFERSPRLIRDKASKGVKGTFCGKSCAGRYARQLQLGKIKEFSKVKPVESEYYRLKLEKKKASIHIFMNKYGIGI